MESNFPDRPPSADDAAAILSELAGDRRALVEGTQIPLNRETGIRFKNMGGGAAAIMAAVLVICLTLFSVSLGLVSLGAGWAVGLTALAAFGLVSWLAGVAYRSALNRLHHV